MGLAASNVPQKVHAVAYLYERCVKVSIYESYDGSTGDRIGILKKSCGSLHFFINGTDLGEAVSKLPGVVYGAVDIYGAAVRVSIVSMEEEYFHQFIIMISQVLDDLEQYTGRTNVHIYGIAEQPDESTDNLAVDFFKCELNVVVASNDINRSHREGKKSRAKPRPFIVQFTKQNTKVAVTSCRHVLKERKHPFNLKEDLTINRCKILKYLNKDIEEGIVSKVWTVDGVICFWPSGDSSIIECCTSLEYF
ncbi:uncharacterized protein LOC122951682 isoform X3 [Acropora millepora]|uniref:uncharacterized protein LOC122951682 isoform X3 n=1 Tax=Acropora millepora TaxID=45264 RepID=UPI001CF3B4B3|nr:uncharacterized protein LOC122951682 isoform X3 [Acropora millepora]